MPSAFGPDTVPSRAFHTCVRWGGLILGYGVMKLTAWNQANGLEIVFECERVCICVCVFVCL